MYFYVILLILRELRGYLGGTWGVLGADTLSLKFHSSGGLVLDPHHSRLLPWFPASQDSLFKTAPQHEKVQESHRNMKFPDSQARLVFVEFF